MSTDAMEWDSAAGSAKCIASPSQRSYCYAALLTPRIDGANARQAVEVRRYTFTVSFQGRYSSSLGPIESSRITSLN